MTPVLELDGLVKEFPTGRRGSVVHAVNGVSLAIAPGETLGVVGESGSGKSTLGRMALRLLEPTHGRIRFEGQDITRLGGGALRAWRARAQVVFQDPRDALSPRMDVRTLIEEPLRLHTDLDAPARLERVVQLLRSVRLDEGYLTRSPRRLSGGEAQRVAIARALATDPTFLVLDEPTSSLDLHVRRSILTLLDTLQQERGLTYLLISHDLHMVAAHADQVAVMYLGRIVETGPAREVFDHPQHPYTQALLSATLSADPTIRPSRILLEGEIPSPIDLPPGCQFASRCPIALDACRTAPPADRSVGPGHTAACLRIDDRTNQLRTTGPAAPRTAVLMEASI